MWIRDAYTKLTGWSTLHDQEAELNTLLSFDVDLPLAQKTAALKTCVIPKRKKERMTKSCPNVLVLELVASSGREAIPIRLLRALSDICLLWEICLVVDEAMTGASLQSRYNLSKLASIHVHCYRSGFRSAPKSPFLSTALGLTPALIVFSKAIYPSGVAANLAHGHFSPAMYARLYPSRTSHASEEAMRQFIASLARMTPEQMTRNWLVGRWLRAKLLSLTPPGCTHQVVQGVGLLLFTTLPLDQSRIAYKYKRLLPPFDAVVSDLDRRVQLAGTSSWGCNSCADLSSNTKNLGNRDQRGIMEQTQQLALQLGQDLD